MPLRTGLRLAVSAFAIASNFAAGSAYAQATKAIINAVANTTYPPFEFKDPTTSKLVGFDIDLLDAIAAKAGVKVNWIESHFDQLLSSVVTKRADIMVGLVDSPQRRESVNFLDYLNEYSVFLTLRDNAARFPNMDLLCGKQVAATRNSTWPDQIAKWSDEHCKAGKPAVIVVGTNGSPDSRLQLNQGRVDAAVGGAGTLAYQNTIENNRYATIAKLNQGELVGYGFSKDAPELGQLLKKGLAAVMADGTYKNLMRKWNLAEDSALERPLINGQP